MNVADATLGSRDPLGTSVESALSFADEPSDVLRERLLLAKRYTWSWIKLIVGWAPVLKAAETPDYISDAPALLARIYSMQGKLDDLLKLITPDSVFPGKAAAAAYNAVSAEWTQLYRDLAVSPAALEQPGVLDTAGSLADGIIQAPGDAVAYAAQQVANVLGTALGGAVAALWPWLLAAGVLGMAWLFRAPLGRALGKVTK